MTTRFEEFEEWQKSRSLVCAIYGVTARGGFHRDPGLRERLRADAVCIMSTLAVASDAAPARRVRTVGRAARTCSSLSSNLVVAFDQGYLTDVELCALHGQASDLRDAIRARAVETAAQSEVTRDRARSEPEAASGGLR